MVADELNLCMGCMSPRFEGGKCPICGYDESLSRNIDYLPPKTILDEHYLVGKLISSDPEGAWYVGYDIQEEMRVWVREYAPGAITRRDHETYSIQPLASAEAQYKALMADFEDLCHALMALPQGEKVIPVLAVFRANNTMYAIYRYIKTISLESFLKRSGGKLPWHHVKKLMMPLYHTVADIHRAGLIHRGLSPLTIHLDQSGALWLGCFTVAAARTNKSELSAQLFQGYAAPEQYSLNSWQGTWTDVYALGAITYRAVTGELPPPAIDRIYGDDLMDSQITSAEMTENVVSAINKALAVEVEDRTQTAESFIAELLSTEGSNTAVYTAAPRRTYESEDDSLRRQEVRAAAAARKLEDAAPHSRFTDYDGKLDFVPPPTPVQKAPSPQRKREKPAKEQTSHPKQRRSHPVLALVCSALAATALLGAAVYWITNTYLSDLISPAGAHGESSSNVQGVDYSGAQNADDKAVPKFVGANLTSITDNEDLQGQFIFRTQEKYDDIYDAGVVCDQKPLEGTDIPSDKIITLYISKGPELLEMPDLVGKPLPEAINALNEMGAAYHVIPIYEKSAEKDTVLRTEPAEVGSKFSKSKTVYLYIRLVEESSSDLESEEEESSSSSKKSVSSSKSNSDASSSKSDSSDTTSRRLKLPNANGTLDKNGNWVAFND